MQHTHTLKKLNFDLLNLPYGEGEGAVGKIFDNMLLHS